MLVMVLNDPYVEIEATLAVYLDFAYFKLQ